MRTAAAECTADQRKAADHRAELPGSGTEDAIAPPVPTLSIRLSLEQADADYRTAGIG